MQEKRAYKAKIINHLQRGKTQSWQKENSRAKPCK